MGIKFTCSSIEISDGAAPYADSGQEREGKDKLLVSKAVGKTVEDAFYFAILKVETVV